MVESEGRRHDPRSTPPDVYDGSVTISVTGQYLRNIYTQNTISDSRENVGKDKDLQL